MRFSFMFSPAVTESERQPTQSVSQSVSSCCDVMIHVIFHFGPSFVALSMPCTHPGWMVLLTCSNTARVRSSLSRITKRAARNAPDTRESIFCAWKIPRSPSPLVYIFSDDRPWGNLRDLSGGSARWGQQVKRLSWRLNVKDR